MPGTPSIPAQRTSESSGRMAGEYRLLRKLGEGGFGAVWEAEHPVLKRRAAVKVLHRVADKDSDAVLRFISEAQAVNQIRNRHIVDVFSFGTLNDGRHFYVMDLLDGEPLDRWLKRSPRVDVSIAMQILTPIAAALDLAHGAGIIHRDLKPQNIFLAWDSDGHTIPKLLDFGMAKLMSESPVKTASGTPIGTPLYMSPEQARGEKVDQRSDVYALGVLAYELLTGRLPFNGDTTVAVLMAHIMAEPPHPSEVCPELSPLFDAPILRMLEKDPTKRPASASDAIQRIRLAAQQAQIELSESTLRLPRPEPEVSSPPPSLEEADTLLDDVGPSGSPAMARSTTVRSARPFPRFWVWALLVGVGGLIGVWAMSSSPAPGPKRAVSLSDAKLGAASTTPSASPQASTAPSVATSPGAEPSASAAPSSSARAPDAKRPGVTTTGNKSKPGAPAKIPTDLENPF